MFELRPQAAWKQEQRWVRSAARIGVELDTLLFAGAAVFPAFTPGEFLRFIATHPDEVAKIPARAARFQARTTPKWFDDERAYIENLIEYRQGYI
jgi:hypothetical protein